MPNSKISFFVGLIALLFSVQLSAQFYSGSTQEFGKNRVQYREFNWLYYPGEKFEVYFYQGGKSLAEYTMQSAMYHLPIVEQKIDYQMEEKIQIVVYNKQNEFRQSNVGLGSGEEYNIGGTSKIVGSKMFIYYEGDHASLDRQIRAGLTEIAINQMMYGGDWKSVFKNSTLLNIPEWYQDGLISYVSEDWNEALESQVQDALRTGKFEHFNRLDGDEAKIAGHAMWKFIADVYGENVIPNILYMTRVSRSIESGFLFVLGLSIQSLANEYRAFYEERYSGVELKKLPELSILLTEKQKRDQKKIESINDDVARAKAEQKFQDKIEKITRRSLGELPVKAKKKYHYSEFKMSPDGKFIAFVTNELGQYKIWLYDVDKGKKKRIYKREHKLERIIDRSFPVLTWHPTSMILTFAFEMQGRAYLGNYNLEDKKVVEKELFRIDKVIDLSYSDDGRKIIFSGVKEGHTDLFLYQVIGNAQQQLTFDIYDDMNPRFIRNSDAVIFASNRPDDTLRADVPTTLFDLNKDIYIMDLTRSVTLLERVTKTPDIDENSPFGYDNKNYTFLRKHNGITNRFIASIDSTISRIDTTVHYRYFTVSNPLSNFPTLPYSYDFNSKSGDYSLTFWRDNRMQFFTGKSAGDQILSTLNFGTNKKLVTTINGEDILSFEQPRNKGEVDINDYEFEDEKKDYVYEKEVISIPEILPSGEIVQNAIVDPDSLKKFQLPKSRNYRLNFATDYVLTQLDNTFSNQFYQNFTGPGGITPGLGALVKLGVSDLFEDKKIIGGFRIAGNLENSDFGIGYINLKKRWDKELVFMRQNQRLAFGTANTTIVQLNTHLLTYKLKYPFNELTSVRITGILRSDRAVNLATDPVNLSRPNRWVNNVGVKVEYVFDNTLSKGINLYNGTRLKVFAEHYQDPENSGTDFNTFGADIRHYQKIHRDLILALRGAGSSSFGSRKLVHYLGGVDNWWFNKVDNDMAIAQDENYYYQTQGTPLRGFWINSRNGNSFAVINAELRWPVFKYFMNTPIKSDFIQNFQLVGFSDVGSAWTGLHPYSEDNSFNTQVTYQNPITVRVHNNREPIIYGYGFGMRSRVLGYFMRLDWSWGVDDGVILPRVFYFSLNLDF